MTKLTEKECDKMILSIQDKVINLLNKELSPICKEQYQDGCLILMKVLANVCVSTMKSIGRNPKELAIDLAYVILYGMDHAHQVDEDGNHVCNHKKH